MKHLKRHWHSVTVLVLAALLAGTFVLSNSYRSEVQAQAGGGPPEPMGAVDRDAVLTLLEETDLDREALVGLNVSANQAQTLLTSVRSWEETERIALAALRVTIATKTEALRQIRSAIRMGPAQEGHGAALATALTELTTARAAYTSALQPLRADVDGELSVSQRAALAAIRGGLGQRMPVRLVDMTPQQQRDLSRAWRHYGWSMGAASTSQQRDAARAAWAAAIAQTLTAGQQQVMTAYGTYFETASGAVADAFDIALPLDEEQA